MLFHPGSQHAMKISCISQQHETIPTSSAKCHDILMSFVCYQRKIRFCGLHFRALFAPASPALIGQHVT